MCGIVGAINFPGKFKSGMDNTMRNLLFADTIRGSDATGLYALTKDGKVDWSKECVDGWAFLSYNKRANEILKDADDHLLLIGHNRAATHGSRDNVDYAHPIVIPDKIGLVHNGTLTQWTGKHKKESTIHDSTAIAQIIAEQGVQEFVDGSYGSYSIVWHDVEKSTINFLRNEDRPMSFVHTEDRVFFGSELLMLLWIIQRNGMKPLKYASTDPMTHYTFELGESEPKSHRITRSYVTNARRRFPQSEWQEGEDEHTWFGDPAVGRWESEYERARRQRTTGHPGYHGSADSRPAIEHGASQSGASLPVVRNIADARRRITGPKPEEKETDKGSNIQSEKVAEEAAKTRPEKDRVTLVDQYKNYKKGNLLTFSVFHYGEIFTRTDGVERFNIHGDPLNPEKDPEVQIRATVKVTSKLTPEIVQKTTKFFLGIIERIALVQHSPTVIIWVRDVELTTVDDPLAIKQPPQLKKEESYETAETTVVLSPTNKGLPEKDYCQGCSKLFPRKELVGVQETCEEARDNHRVERIVYKYRFCHPCTVQFSTDRDSVVPDKAKGKTSIDCVITRTL